MEEMLVLGGGREGSTGHLFVKVEQTKSSGHHGGACTGHVGEGYCQVQVKPPCVGG